jgi:hypothetical protein
VTKNGYARYALKRLHNDLTELERARGMVDLAVEAKYLSLVWHPNISTYLLGVIHTPWSIVVSGTIILIFLCHLCHLVLSLIFHVKKNFTIFSQNERHVLGSVGK